MKNKALLLIATEFFWWALFLVIAVVSILPIAGFIRQDLLLINGGLAVVFAACFRYVIFFNKVEYLKPVGVKVLLFLANIVFFFWLLNSMQDFLALFDDHDISFFLTDDATPLSGEKILSMYGFFKKEFLFFSVGILMLSFFLELLLMRGILQRVKNIE